jgi:hypothetical protein
MRRLAKRHYAHAANLLPTSQVIRKFRVPLATPVRFTALTLHFKSRINHKDTAERALAAASGTQTMPRWPQLAQQLLS